MSGHHLRPPPPAREAWACAACTLENANPLHLACVACLTPRQDESGDGLEGLGDPSDANTTGAPPSMSRMFDVESINECMKDILSNTRAKQKKVRKF